MKINQKLKERRISLGLTLEDVAKAVGVSKATVLRWENGEIANMRRDKIAKLANILNVSPIFIMDLDCEHTFTVETAYPLQTDEKKLVDDYRQLNPDGKAKAKEYISDLTTMDKYTTSEDLKSKLG